MRRVENVLAAKFCLFIVSDYAENLYGVPALPTTINKQLCHHHQSKHSVYTQNQSNGRPCFSALLVCCMQ